MEVIHEPFDHSLRDDDGVVALVAKLVPVPGPKNGSNIVLS